MIPARELRDWADEELLERRAHLVDIIKKAMGSHYPKIWGGEIGQIDKELERRKPKTIFVSWSNADNDYRFCKQSEAVVACCPKGALQERPCVSPLSRFGSGSKGSR